MISVQQTIDIIKENQPVEKVTTVKTPDALNMVLAEEIFATIDSPSYTNSAMDGFAVFWADVQNAHMDNPVSLKIAGESSAGHPFTGQVNQGETVRISTGALLPEQLDTVIPIEKCVFDLKSVKILEAIKKNQNIRFIGDEFKKGEKLLNEGITIGSAQVALLASLGISRVKVIQKPRITLMITGSELISYEHFTESHQLRDSNTPMLTAAVTEAGGEIVNSVHVKDDASLIRLILESAVNNSDLIISSGGVSMGNHDHVREMAVKAGFKELAWMINQKPGKPMFLAKKEETLLLALPGNPVSAYICFKHYLRPLIQSMQGKSFSWPTMNAHVSEIIENKSGRTHLMRVNLKHQEQEFIVFPLARQGSHMISSIAAADGYIILPGGSKFSKGELLEVFLF